MSKYQLGVDYLIDYYAVLGVSREANKEAIKLGYRTKQKQYHPDRYEGLAPEFQERAKERSRILGDAYKVLSSPNEKKAYDAQLAAWEGPLSEDGSVVIDPTRPRFSATGLLTGQLMNEETLARQRKLADDLAGYNPTTFRVIEQQYEATKNPSPELEAAYREQLAAKDLHEELLESFEFQTVGLENRKTVALYRGLALERFEEAANRIRTIAANRHAIIEKRYQMVPREYRPPQETIFPKLVVCMEIKDHRIWMVFERQGSQVIQDNTVNEEELRQLTDPVIAQTWIDRGYNVLFYSPMADLDVKDELEEVVLWHFEKLED